MSAYGATPSLCPTNKSKGGRESKAPSSTTDKTRAAPQPRRRSPRFGPNNINAANNCYAGAYLARISRGALNDFIGNAFLEELKISRVNGLKINGDPNGIEHIANGVAHPVTKEITTKYQKLFSDPLLRDFWAEAMAKERGRLAQGYDDVDGTDTIIFLDRDGI